MNKTYEPGWKRQDWDLDSLMADASVSSGSNGANLEHSVTTRDQTLLQNPDTGALESPDEAVTVNPLGQCSMEGQRRHPNASSSFIQEPNRGLRQPMAVHPSYGDMNRKSKNRRLIVTDQIDGLSPRADYDDSGFTPSTDTRKRSAPEDSFPFTDFKKRKIEPSPTAPVVHEPTPSFPPTHPSETFGPPRGGQKSKAKPLSTMREEEYYYRQRTAPNDQIYFHNVIKNLRAVDYLQDPQTLEPTISSEAGRALVGGSRASGPGRASGDESVYAILVDKPPSGPFLCWICGHLEKQRKGLRVLGHVREHFEHKPWACVQNHRAIQNDNGNPENRRVRVKDGPWCGPSS
jgi:hypothetical protein